MDIMGERTSVSGQCANVTSLMISGQRDGDTQVRAVLVTYSVLKDPCFPPDPIIL